MPGSAVLRFSDPDKYGAFVRGTKAEVTVTKPGLFEAKLIRVDLHRLWMQRYSETLPRIAHFDHIPGRAFFMFETHAGPAMLVDGAETPPGSVMRHPERYSAFLRSLGPSQFASMSLPIGDMQDLGATMAGCDLTPPREPLHCIPAPAAIQRLQSLHAAAGDLAEHAPRVIACPEAARGLEQALIGALVDCIGPDSSLAVPANAGHATVMKKFFAILEEGPDRVVHLTEMCRRIGVSRRLLSACCNKALGMGPYHYLRLRQMHLARRGLLMADAAATTVTEVATAHGFWELGRFAVAYRALFGESPSATLRTPPGSGGDAAALANFSLQAQFA
nr:helix-turn-helix domain-containing protein [uncultured Rhodopila sp.]